MYKITLNKLQEIYNHLIATNEELLVSEETIKSNQLLLKFLEEEYYLTPKNQSNE